MCVCTCVYVCARVYVFICDTEYSLCFIHCFTSYCVTYTDNLISVSLSHIIN